MLLYVVGPKADDVYSTFTVAAGATYQQVMSAFDGHFNPKVNVIFARAKFNGRMQAECETIEQFVTDLHVLADKCDFGTLKTDFIRDRLVIGVKDRELSERLEMDPELTLEKAAQQARQAEEVQARRDLILRSTRDTECLKISKYPVQTSGRSCFWCGKQDIHGKNKCPATSQQCNVCHRMGHFGAVCRQRGRPAVGAVQQSDDDPNFLGGIFTETPKGWSADIKVGESAAIQFRLDSGADESVVPLEMYDQCLSNIPIHATKLKLVAAAGQELDIIGVVRTTLEWKDRRTRPTQIYVLRGIVAPLLSYKHIRELQILSQVAIVSARDPVLDYPDLFDHLGRATTPVSFSLEPEAKPHAISAPRKVPIPLRPS